MGPCSSFTGDLFDHHIWFVKRTNHIFHIHGWEWWGCLIDRCNAWMHFWPWHASEIMWKMGGEGTSVECNKRGLPIFSSNWQIRRFLFSWHGGVAWWSIPLHGCLFAISLLTKKHFSERHFSFDREETLRASRKIIQDICELEVQKKICDTKLCQVLPDLNEKPASSCERTQVK